jgi:[acyl-carrier-protein] S-malonyltransferase
MGRALADAYPEARAAFDEADAAFAAARAETADAEPALSTLCFEGPAERLALTEITQPAMVAASTAACRVLAREGLTPAFVAGHSLGEYSAHVAAGTITLGDAVGVVRRRGRYMQEAVPVGTGAMAAVLGLDADTLARVCEAAAEGEVVSPANMNGPGQVAIAGAAAAVERASARAKAAGARRVVPLAVSAPFHCALMLPAERRLEPVLRALTVADPRVPVVANVDAEPKRTGAESLDALVRQVSSPVRWEDVVRRLAAEGVHTYVEVGPGSVLSGLVRKIHKDAQVLRFASPSDLGAVVTGCSTSAAR